MTAKALLLLCGAFLLAVTIQRSFVATAPTQLKQGDPDRDPDPITRNLESTEDANVKDLESLKHSIGKTLELMKSQTTDYANHQKNSNHEDMDGRGVTPFEGHPYQINNKEEGSKTAVVQDSSQAQTTKNKEPEFTKNGNRRNIALIPYSTHNVVASTDADKAIDEVAALAAVAAVDDVRNHSGDHKLPKHYNSLDMAEYIFWTGDEKGVSVAIEEFLQEGLMSREEAINFLQEIKYNLDYLQTHYSRMGLNGIKGHIVKDDPLAAPSTGTSSAIPLFSKDKQRINGKPTLNNNFEITRLRQEPVTKKDLRPRLADDPAKNTDVFPRSGTSSTSMKESTLYANPNPQDLQSRQMLLNKLQEYALVNQERQQQADRPTIAPDMNTVEMLDRLHTADMLYTEYSLEEVIYQLARVMFQQALMKGNAEAQQTLHRFTQFLETEADQARISRSLEKTVFDVLIAALADTLSEHPELTNTGPTLARSAAAIIQKQQQRIHGSVDELPLGMADRNTILRQLIEMSAQNAEKNHELGEMGPMRIAINTVKYKAE